MESRKHADGAAEGAHQEVGGAEIQQQDVADDALVPDGGGDEGVRQESHGKHQSVEDDEGLDRRRAETERRGVGVGGVGGGGVGGEGEVERRRHAMLTSRERASSGTDSVIDDRNSSLKECGIGHHGSFLQLLLTVEIATTKGNRNKG